MIKRVIVIATSVYVAGSCMALTPTPGRTATEKWAWAASAEQTTNIVTRQFVEDLGITSGVTPAVVTNIANSRIDAKVATWAMKGQPKPEGISPSVVTSIVESAAVTNGGAKAYADAKFYTKAQIDAASETIERAINGKVDKPTSTVPVGYILAKAAGSGGTGTEWIANTGAGVTPSVVTNIASSAAVTNEGAVASSKAYADGTFLKTIGGTVTGPLCVKNSVIVGEGGGYLDSFSLSNMQMMTFEGNGIKIGQESMVFSLYGFVPTESELVPDNSPVVTSNMLNGVLTPALAQKADRAVPSAANNFASLTAHGNLADSTYSPSSFRSSSWVPSWSQVTSKPSWIGSSKPTYTYSEVGAAPAVTGGYLPRSAGENYPLTGKLYLNDSNCYLYGNNDSGGFLWIVANAIAFSNGSSPETRSDIFPDGTPVMTEGQADFHIITTSPVTSGQIGNFNITNLTAKTISCNVSTTSGMASDILIWTYGNTAECQMTFTLPSGFTLVGDAADTKASANKKCLFSLVKISNTEVIVSKKEY